MPNFLINTDKNLINIIDELNKSKYIGIDTEFIRESTYYPVLALLQISTANATYCIDILSISQKKLISDLLGNDKIKKIIHSSKQDLEVLYSYFNCYPKNIFDTQVASNLIVEDINISYSNIVKKYFDVDLKPGSWRTNWLERPISSEKLEYAANDVKYLIELYKVLSCELEKLNRLDWFEEEQQNELSKDNIIIKPKDAWKKVNVPTKFNKTQKLELRSLAEWRESNAINKNLPKRWIFSDSELIKIIVSSPRNIDKALDCLKHEMNMEDKNMIKDIIQRSQTKNLGSSSKSIDLSKYNIKINKCQKILEEVSSKYNISHALIANKRELDLFAKEMDDIKFMQGWRFKIFGKLVQ